MSKHAFTLLLCAATFSACLSLDQNPFWTQKYIVMPGARFAPKQDTSITYPDCPTADDPLSCGSGCCPEGYPFACQAQNRCYNQQPVSECPGGFVVCSPPNLLITKIEPHEATLHQGESVTVQVFFKKWGKAAPKKLIVKMLGVDGEFERDITPDEAVKGQVEALIQVTTQRPSSSVCSQSCAGTGTCGTCFASSPLSTWVTQFAVVDENGSATGTLLAGLTLSFESTTSPGNECTDTSRCCQTMEDCGGGIGCTIVAITVPDSCGKCPSGTTQSGVDVHYHLLDCSCDACSE